MPRRQKHALSQSIGPSACTFFFQGALKGTNLRGQTEPKRRFSLIFADILAFSWKTKHFGNADFRRKPQIFAGNRRKP